MTSHSSPLADTSNVTPAIRLLVVELIHHADIVRRMAELFSKSERLKVSFLVSKPVYEQAELGAECFQHLEIRIKERSETVPEFFQQNIDLIENIDLIYINTIEKYFRDFVNFEFKKPILTRIHNVNADLAPWSHLDFQGPLFLKSISYVIRRGLFQRRFYFKKRFLEKSTGLIFANDSITKYAKGLKAFNLEKLIAPILPFCFIRESNPYKSQQVEEVRIAITGGIDTNRKDYESIYSVFSKSIRNFSRPVHLKLLGKPKGREGWAIVEKFEKLKSDIFKFSYNSDFIPAEEYDLQLKEVDFLVAPIRVNTHYRVFKETYGRSKMSGIENDIISYQKPVLITNEYALDKKLMKVSETYSTEEELGLLLTNWINERAYSAKAAQFSGLSQFQPRTIEEQCYTHFRELIERYTR